MNKYAVGPSKHQIVLELIVVVYHTRQGYGSKTSHIQVSISLEDFVIIKQMYILMENN